MERRLEMHVFPYLGERDVQLLRAPELLEVLRRIESRGTHHLAHRVRSICSRVLRYARATGRKCEDVAADLYSMLCVGAPIRFAWGVAIGSPDNPASVEHAAESVFISLMNKPDGTLISEA